MTSFEYKQSVELLDHLIDVVGENENHVLASFMDSLGNEIEKYEAVNVPELNAN